MAHRLPIVLVSAAAAVTLAACSSSGGGGDDKTTPPPAQTAAASTPTVESSSPSTDAAAGAGASSAASSSAATAPSAPVAVNKTITDPVLGNKTTILKYVTGYQPSAASKAKFSALEDEDVVLVDVKVTAGTKYYGSVGADDFRLTATKNGIDETTTTILDDEVKAAGYPPLQDTDTGKTGTGWLIFTPKKGLPKLVFRYERLAYKGSDGKDIPAKNFDVPLD